MGNIVIGIEGMVGAGKTSIARSLLSKIPNSIVLHGGNIYRAILYGILEKGLPAEELAKTLKGKNIKQIMEDLDISIGLQNRETVVYMHGKEIEETNLQSQETSMAVSRVSHVADNHSLYAFGKSIIDDFKTKYNVILSSRDIMKMYPETEYHFFITASLEERVKRKCIQYGGEEKSIREHIEKRDKLQEKSGFYQTYANTIIIDATHFQTPEEGAEEIMRHIKLPTMV